MTGRKLSDGWSSASKATGVIFMLLICAGSLRAQQTCGYVLDLRGEWTLSGNGAAKLSKGSSLSVGGVVTATDPSDSNSYIVMADRSGKIFDKRICRNAGECTKAIRLPRSVGGNQSFMSQVVGAAMALISNEPAKYSSFISRDVDLQEAVVKLNAQKLDLSPVFRNMQGDHYLVRFEKIGKDKRVSDKPLKPFPFNWDSRKPAPLLARDLSPGLYRVSVLDVSLLEPEGANESSGNEAWVLVASQNEYDKAAPSFNAAVNVTKQWGANVKQSAVRQFLRATLDFITTQSTQ